MKNTFKHIKSKKGMTYVELLVALSILALIVVVFTPILMYSYENLYNAGEINVNTYEVKSNIEGALAVRKNNYKVDTRLKLRELSESVDLMMWRIVGSIEGLETMYGSSKRSVTYLGEKIFYDNVSTLSFEFKFSGFAELNNDSFIKSSYIEKNQIGYIVETPLNEGQINTSQYLVAYDGAQNIATITVSGVDVTCSPLKVTIFYVDSDGTAKYLVNYMEIKPTRIMFVGAADGDVGYYTSEGLNEDGTLSLEARKMIGGSVASGTQFNKVRWISNGVDSRGGFGYYAMCGNDGVIRRLWCITDNEKTGIPDYASIGQKKLTDAGKTYYKYSWGGDYTENHTYGVSGTSVIGKNIVTGARVFKYGMKANTFTKYSGIALNNASRDLNSIKISKNIASSVNLSPFVQDGLLFYTYFDNTSSPGGLNSSTSQHGGLKRKWKVNWEDDDKVSIWGEGYAFATKYSGEIWANYITGQYKSGFNGYDQPVVFFAKYGGARNNSSSGGLRPMSSANQITTAYQMTDNNNGTVSRTISANWHRFDIGGVEGGYINNDEAARFNEVPANYSATSAKVYNSSETINVDKSYFTAEQNQLLRYIINTFSDGVRKVSAAQNVFDGITSSPAYDLNLPYVRMKCYTNAYSNDANANVTVLTRDIYNSDENSAINSATQNTMMNNVSITLKDLCFTTFPQSASGGENPAMSSSHLLYTGYTPVSALLHATIPSNAHETTKGTAYTNYIVRGVGGSSYTVSEFNTSDHPKNTTILPTTTATDGNTAFTLGYASNRALFYKNETYMNTYNKEPSTSNGLQFTDDYTTYLGYAQDGEATLAVGYKTIGNAAASYTLTSSCKNAAHGFGSKPLVVDSTFFYNSRVFKKANEDMHTVTNANGGPYRMGYYLEAAYEGNSGTASGYVLSDECKCAISYTCLSFAGTNNNQPISNVGTIAVHFGGGSAFKTIYTAPSGDFRFTCAELIDIGADSYVAYIGDSLGNIWRLDFEADSPYAVPFIPTVKGKTLNAAYTNLTEINDLIVTTEKIIAVGKTASGGTKIVVYDNDTEDVEVNTISGNNYILHDIEYYNGYYYAVGVNGVNGVILCAADASGTWTTVTTAKNANGVSVNLKPLYSLAVQQ